MNFTKFICYFAIFIFEQSLFSCQKSSNVQTSNSSQITIDHFVSGVITDLNNTPLSNATVTGGSASATTDVNGKFTLTKVQFRNDTIVVNVLKTGFFEGSKTYVSSTGSINDAKIQLIHKSSPKTITASSGGIVGTDGGGSINFTGGFVNTSNASPYTGDVYVSTFYLDPTNQNFSASVPGSLKGVSTANQQGVLQSFGVVAVEINDASGNKLQLAQGKAATITLPIPVALLAKAPGSIPLWYFDDVKGLWKQEGTATKQGDNFVGLVNHFSFWSVGYIFDPVNLTVIATLDTGIAYKNKLVTITLPDSTSTKAYTDNTGTVKGLVPVNEVLRINVINDCGKIVFTKNVGPFSGDATVNVNITNDNCVSTDTTQFIKMTINNRTYSWQSYQIRQSYQAGTSTFIFGQRSQNPLDSAIVLDATIFSSNQAPGSYPIAILITINGTYTYQAGGQSYDGSYPYPTNVITRYEAVGGYIEGSVSGKIKTFPSTATADSFALSGTYRVKRLQ